MAKRSLHQSSSRFDMRYKRLEAFLETSSFFPLFSMWSLSCIISWNNKPYKWHSTAGSKQEQVLLDWQWQIIEGDSPCLWSQDRIMKILWETWSGQNIVDEKGGAPESQHSNILLCHTHSKRKASARREATTQQSRRGRKHWRDL